MRGSGAVVKAVCLDSRRSGLEPQSGPPSFKETKCFFPAHWLRFNIVGEFRPRQEACSASDRQGSNFESCAWRAVSSHHPQKVLLAQFSLYVHKGGLKPHSFHFQSWSTYSNKLLILNWRSDHFFYSGRQCMNSGIVCSVELMICQYTTIENGHSSAPYRPTTTNNYCILILYRR